jgi:hypothetical protein
LIGRGSAYLEARLRRSHPEIAAAYDWGEFKSLKAAARSRDRQAAHRLPGAVRRLAARLARRARGAFQGFIVQWLQQYQEAA